MARDHETWSHDDVRVHRPRRRLGWLGWVLFLTAMGLAGAFISYVYFPLRDQRADLQRQVTERDQRVRQSTKRLQESQTKLADFERTHAELSGQLARTQVEKDQLEGELKRVQGELSAKLEPEIQAGNVHIRRRGNDLVVDLADDVLFESGSADMHETGKKVLAPVAPTLAALKEFTIQVAGHTDSARVTSPTTQERFPTNWELSAARATNVVRFLQDAGKVSGERLVAMGFAEYRPAASNATAKGRQQNRRIEIVLIRR